MDSKSKMLWHQGQFLQPQHFQYHDSYISSLFEPYASFLSPEFWGTGHLEINESALGGKEFEISAASFMFQDGTWAQYPGNSVLTSRNFADDWTESDKPFKIYIGLRRTTRTGKNVTEKDTLDEPAQSRYIAKHNPDEMQDIYLSGPVGHVKTMQYCLHILWENELDDMDGYMIMQVAELYREGESIILSKKFLPPLLSTGSSETLMWMLRDLRDQILTRCRQLDDYKSGGSLDISAGDANSLKYLLALRSLNRYLPAVAQVADNPVMHPANLYGLLRQILGELSTFTGRVNVMGETYDGNPLLSKYNHEKPYKAFNDIFLLLSEILNSIIIGPEHIIKLTREDGFFSAAVPPEAMDSRNEFYLSVKTAVDEQTVIEGITDVAKISSKENISLLLTRALPGIQADFCPIPPAGLPRKPETSYFKLNRNDNKWSEVQLSRNISVYWDSASEDTAMELIILKR